MDQHVPPRVTLRADPTPAEAATVARAALQDAMRSWRGRLEPPFTLSPGLQVRSLTAASMYDGADLRDAIHIGWCFLVMDAQDHAALLNVALVNERMLPTHRTYGRPATLLNEHLSVLSARQQDRTLVRLLRIAELAFSALWLPEYDAIIVIRGRNLRSPHTTDPSVLTADVRRLATERLAR